MAVESAGEGGLTRPAVAHGSVTSWRGLVASIAVLAVFGARPGDMRIRYAATTAEGPWTVATAVGARRRPRMIALVQCCLIAFAAVSGTRSPIGCWP